MENKQVVYGASSAQPVNKAKSKGIRAVFHNIKAQKYLQMMTWPAVIWMFIFSYIPMYGIVIAFMDYNITRPIFAAPWVGLKHFIAFFSDANFARVMTNTLGLSILSLTIGFSLPIMFALLLNEITSIKFKRVVQTVSYLPHFISWVVLGGILINWLSSTGFVNEVLIKIGVQKESITYLSEPRYFWGICIISDIWKELGWNTIIYLAAIAGINPELHEAAIVDGAGRFKRMWHITLPGMKGTIAILLILAVSGILGSNFDQIFVLRNTLNAPASQVLNIFVYNMGIQMARYSYATAAGLFQSLVSVILLVVANMAVRKLTDQSLF